MTDNTTSPVLGELHLVDGPISEIEPTAQTRKPPAAAVAARLLGQTNSKHDLIFIAASERRADDVGRALGSMVSSNDPGVLIFPPWDCLPYDRAAPSRDAMGRRMAVLAALAKPSKTARLVITSPEAVSQRTPPRDVVGEQFEIVAGQGLDRDLLAKFSTRTGYVVDDRIDEPGEIAFLGEVIDVFPPAEATPFRIVLSADNTVDDIKAFDAVTQRTGDAVSSLRLTPASELIIDEVDGDPSLPGSEHRLLEHYAQLDTLFSLLPKSRILLDIGVPERLERFGRHVMEAYDSRRSFGEADGLRPPAPEALYLLADEMSSLLKKGEALDLLGLEPTPSFALSRSPGAALKLFVQAQREMGQTVVFTGLDHEQRIISRLLKRNGIEAPAGGAWGDLDDTGAVVAVTGDFDAGYEDRTTQRTVITPTDITGGRMSRQKDATTNPFGETEIRVGDVVIHEDHGLGVLQALERIEADGVEHDVLRLEYHGGATVLAPVDEFGRIWRYGSEPAAVTLDRLNTQGWPKRRAEVSAQIDATAARMVEMAKAREGAKTPAIVPAKGAYARFTARFPFPESIDQSSAIDAVLADLASGRPMNRLVCGDVGFGKTEVALRAAAAVALCGRQVLIAAPTTVLARQHYETFRRRFEGTDIKVAELSRLVDGAEARAVKAGLADGSIGIVVGTQGLAAAGVAFADLALVVIDEEHRFGAKLKADLSDRAPHLLSMSATPIPRTLQSAMVGIQDVSIIASPPARRRPIRTFLTDFDGGSVRMALTREKMRGGQSFVVAPRIEDLEPLFQELARLTPELDVLVAHGKLSADDMDSAMTRFADGQGDVLLATNIIENGLDVPQANTMLIWRPDRFGLAQLHQLRGRVGRGRRQGFAYLLNDPETPMADNTRSRLQTLEALDRLGSGFAISARDLDLRGGGDLVGDEQAGHIRLIGASLYQRVLATALKVARGEQDAEVVRPKLNLPSGGSLSEEYVPDATLRINLYARLARLSSADEIDLIQEEIEDRFGPLPQAAEALLAAHRLAALAVAAGVREVVSGPKATAFAFGPKQARALTKRLPPVGDRRWSENRLIVQANDGQPHDQAFVESVLMELAAA
jgi:transcription-repair coupling factor (superfamily II helicase)